MKIIKASIDLDSWKLPIQCNKCKSDLELCAKDIRYNYGSAKNSSYYSTCILCDNLFYMADADIPPIITKDILKHRADKSYSYWD